LRNWLVLAYQDNTFVYHTYVYDFETKGWFELQKGVVSLGIFELNPGNKILVGGGADGNVYVLDDLNGDVTLTNTTKPAGLFRTSLIDFGDPTSLHQPFYLEIEVSDPALMSSTTVNFYLDPTDADNPGTPIVLDMNPVQGETNRFRGFFAAAEGGTGVVCKRLMVELSVASDTNDGSFRSIVLQSNKVRNLMR
jgi:hypothetical protein